MDFLGNNLQKKIDLLEALKLVKLAWGNVTVETICNCFRKAGFIPGIGINTADDLKLWEMKLTISLILMRTSIASEN